MGDLYKAVPRAGVDARAVSWINPATPAAGIGGTFGCPPGSSIDNGHTVLFRVDRAQKVSPRKHSTFFYLIKGFGRDHLNHLVPLSGSEVILRPSGEVVEDRQECPADVGQLGGLQI
ncbi:hypothetical protein RW1_009_00020 [Rhodococcus wratislaviensis NBRC 100605]|uniref:Uncharacterized protein n=1 Tax=Rhodococcus wratislaviensis NBRC 100605 TaxID=1219028 RepID=X0PMA9_RHOWR|nr:hypothetical protein RW1_009_00020 [Rhodococcus wratislaviensis NBRC 100605]